MGNQGDVVTNGLTDTHAYNAANEITGVDSDTSNVAHDKAGNMTKIPRFDNGTVIGHLALSYDAWNRLVKVETDDATPVTVAAIVYDGTNRRTSKVITNSETDWNHTYHFYYDGQSMIETRNVSDEVIKQHVWGTQYVDEIIQIGMNDDPGADDDGAAGTQDNCETFYWAVQDANYNVMGLVDSDGDLVERYEYTPYGRRRVLIDGGSDPLCTTEIPHTQGITVTSTALQDDQVFGLCDIGHQGLMHDKEFALIYNRARYLHPVLGRFTGRDPLEYADGMSMYEYVGSGPIGRVDWTGTTGPASISEQRSGGRYRRTYVYLNTSDVLRVSDYLPPITSKSRRSLGYKEKEGYVRALYRFGSSLVKREDLERWATESTDHSEGAYKEFGRIFDPNQALPLNFRLAEDRQPQFVQDEFVEIVAMRKFKAVVDGPAMYSPVIWRVSGFEEFAKKAKGALSRYPHVSADVGDAYGKFGSEGFKWPRGKGPGMMNTAMHEAVHALDYENSWYWGGGWFEVAAWGLRIGSGVNLTGSWKWKSEGLAYGMETNLWVTGQLLEVEKNMMDQSTKADGIAAWPGAWKRIARSWNTSNDVYVGKRKRPVTGKDLEDVLSKLKIDMSCKKLANALSKAYTIKRICLPCSSDKRLPKVWK